MTSKTLAALAMGLFILACAWAAYTIHSQRQALASAQADLITVHSAALLATAAAQACSASVADMAEQAAAQALKHAADREAAQAHAARHNATADRILATAPANPGDDCASAQARVSAILAARPRVQP